MNSGVNKVVRPFMAVWRVLAFALIICATGGAWAAETTISVTAPAAWGGVKPKALWNGDFVVSQGSAKRGAAEFATNDRYFTINNGVVTIGSNYGGMWIHTTTGQSFPISIVTGLSDVPTPAANGYASLITMRPNMSPSEPWQNYVGIMINGSRNFQTCFGGTARTSATTYGITYPSGSDRSYFSFVYPYKSGNTQGYVNGTKVVEESLYSSTANYDATLGFSIGGRHGVNSWNATGMKVHYAAILATADHNEVAKWELTDMTSAENITLTDGKGSLTGGNHVGVNLNSGTVTVSGNKTAAALFVQADTTLDFSDDPESHLDILGPLYVADGKKLTIKLGTLSKGWRKPISMGSCFASTGQVELSYITPDGSVTTSVVGAQYIKVFTQTTEEAEAQTAAQIDYSKWSTSVNSVWTWKETGNKEFHEAQFAILNTSTGEDSEETYAGNSTTAPISGDEPRTCYEDKAGPVWYYFAHTHNTYHQIKGYYAAPGRALRLIADTAETTYKKTIDASFGPLTFGGILLEPGAAGYSLTGTGDRKTFIGDPTGATETWTAVNETFEINREGQLYLTGTNNIDIAAGKILKLNYAQTTEAHQPKIVATVSNADNSYATTAGGTLKMHGTGQIEAKKFTATGACLDYSDLSSSLTSPYIDAELVVDGSTTYKFPAGANFPYPVATSVSGSPAGNLTFTVGETGYSRPISFINGKAYPALSSSFAGGDSGTWAGLTWDLTCNDLTSVPAYEVVVSETGVIDLGTLNVPKVTFNVNAGKTLTLKGTVTADEICVKGDGKVVCFGNGTLNGKITGSGTIEYPEHVLPADTADWSDSDWRGTLVLVNCGHENVSAQQTVRFDLYGNEHSRIKAPGFKGYSAMDSGTRCEAELVIDEGTVFEFNHGDTSVTGVDAGFRFRKLSGAGKLRLDGDSDTAQYIFENLSGFTGDVDITDPSPDAEVGGKKSFIFGASPGWSIQGVAFPANLVIEGNVAVGAGRTWDIPAGIIITGNGTLTLGSGARVSGISTRSEGILQVLSGTGTLIDVKKYPETSTYAIASKVIIAYNTATLAVCDTNTITSLTFPADNNVTYVNNGLLDLTGCGSLKELRLELGSSTTFDLSKVSLPQTCTKVIYEIGETRNKTYTAPNGLGAKELHFHVVETAEEFGLGSLTINVPAGTTKVTVSRYDGTTEEAAISGTTASLISASAISGEKIWHDWEFNDSENRLADSGGATETRLPLTAGGEMAYVQDGSTDNYFVNLQTSRPSAALSLSGKSAWSVAIRCQTPTGNGQVVVAFGDTTNGGFGLVSGAAENEVLLVKWVGDSTYSVLSRLVVERATTAFHVYALAVDETRDEVSFYRDGEFINTESFTATIGGFTLGTISGGFGNTGLSSAANGLVDYVRVFDGALSDAMIAALAAENPFESSIATYERTVDVLADWSASETVGSSTLGVWTKKSDGTKANVPTSGANVTLTVDGETAMSVNLAGDVAYETMIFNGDGPIVLWPANDNAGTISAETVVMRISGTVHYGVVDFSEALVGVDAGKTLTFDFSDYPFSTVSGNGATVIPVVGRVGVNDNTRFAVKVDSKPAYISSVEIQYNSTRNGYDVVITPDHTDGLVYYKSGYWGDNTFSVVRSDGSTPTIVLPGDTVVVDGKSTQDPIYIGANLPDNVALVRLDKDVRFASGDAGATILGGVTFTGSGVLTIQRNWNNIKLGNVIFNTDNTVVLDNNSHVLEIAGAVSGTAGVYVGAGKTVTIAAGGSIGNTIYGSGTINMGSNKFNPVFATEGESKWTGTVVCGWSFTSGSYEMNTYGNVNSMVENSVAFSGYLGGDSGKVVPTLKLSNDFTFSNGWSYGSGEEWKNKTTFSRITGPGALKCTWETANTSYRSYYVVENIDGVNYSGTIQLGKYNAIAIGAVEFTEAPAVNTRLVKVTLDEDSEIFNIDGSATNDVTSGTATIAVKVGGSASNYKLLYADDGLYVAVASAEVGGNTTYFKTVDAAVSAAAANGEITVLVDSDTVAVNPGQTVKVSSGVYVGTITWGAEYATVAEVTGNGSTSYRATNTAKTYTWTGADANDNNWSTPGNWQYDDAQTATRAPTSIDSVVFTDGATVSCADVTVYCEGMVVNGGVTLSGANGKDINIRGNITGTGVLTLNNACLKNGLGSAISVANTVEVHFTNDSEIASGNSVGITFNGPVSISGTLKVWDTLHTVAGMTTLNGNITIGGNNGLTLSAVTVAANTTPIISGDSITINGAVAIADGATFTIPASGLTVGNSASFVLSGRSSVLVDNGIGASGKVSTSMTDGARVVSTTAAGVTTYKVGYGTIFSVW